MAHMAFKIPDFWPHDPNNWFRKIESKFRICNIRQSSTKYDHLLSALPTDICSSINDSLAEIDENADDAYKQLKELLMTRYTMDRWARAFELLKFPEIGDMKPSEIMWQMKALLPPDSTTGTYFMAATISPTHRPQAIGHIPVPHHAAAGPPAATTLLHRRIHIRYQTHTRPGKRGGRRLEPPAFSSCAVTAARPADLSSLAAKDWLEESLAAPEQPILAAIADAQLINFSAMAAAQRSCPEVAEMMNSTTLQIITQAVADETLLGDVSTGVFRPLVPIQHREAVFQSMHSIHHPGVQATRRLIAARFCWPQMAKAITMMARAFLHCQLGKVHEHVHLQPAEIPVPHCHFPHIHVDLVGPIPPSRGHTYLFTIIDRTSRWPEAIPLTSISAADCTRALFAGWVSLFGVTATITSDRGAQFTSALCSLLNIQHLLMTVYHPQSNRLVERFHRRLKDPLRSRVAAADWHDHLPWVMLGIRASFREDSEQRRRCSARS